MWNRHFVSLHFPDQIWETGNRECALSSKYSHNKDYKVDADFLQGGKDIAYSEGIFQVLAPKYELPKQLPEYYFRALTEIVHKIQADIAS